MTESLGDSQPCSPADELQLEGPGGPRAGIEEPSHQQHPLLSSASCPPSSNLPPCPLCSQCPPSPGCLKHKQAPVFTSCHSGSRQAGNRNQDCLDWGLDRIGRSHARHGAPGAFSGQAGAGTGSAVLEKTGLRLRQRRRLAQVQMGCQGSTGSMTQVSRLPVQCSSHCPQTHGGSRA